MGRDGAALRNGMILCVKGRELREGPSVIWSILNL